MYLKSLLVSIFFLIIAHSIVASTDDSWNKGFIQLDNKQKVWGDINYNARYDLVQCKTEGVVKTFSPRTVISFRYYDEALSVNRYFRTVEEQTGFYRKQSFYEVVMDGPLKILRKKKDYSGFKLEGENYNVHEKDYVYFVSDGEKLVKISKFKKEIIKGMMSDMALEVNSYMKEQKLIAYKLRDQILIIDYYNELKDGAGKLSVLR
jgi:hypothetical protein